MACVESSEFIIEKNLLRMKREECVSFHGWFLDALFSAGVAQ